MDCIYVGFPSLQTTRGALQHKPAFSHSHMVAGPPAHHEHYTPSNFDMRTAEARDRTTNHLMSGRPTSPNASNTFMRPAHAAF